MADLFVSEISPAKKRLKRLRRLSDSHREWSGLPRNILLCIMDKLIDVDDYVQFGAVCRDWQIQFLEEVSNRPLSPHPPFLLIAPPPPQHRDHHHQHLTALYNLTRDRVYHFRLGMLKNKVCCGSSFGWLVTFKAKEDLRIQLQNPFLNRSIHLPPLDTILQQHPEPKQRSYRYYLRKAVLSSDPTSSPNNFVVMAIMGKYFGLAFYKSGNTTWTSVGDDWDTQWTLQCRSFHDVIFFHKTNQFYAGDRSGAVFAIDFLDDEAHPKITQIAPRVDRHERFLTYLVEDLSSGDLFQVFKSFEFFTKVSQRVTYGSKGVRNVDKRGWKTTTTVQFTVLKLDTTKGDWIEVDDLGENVIFLGKNASVLRPTSDCPGCEPNCIYYTDDDIFTYRSNIENYGLPKDGIYNLKTGVFRPHYSSTRSGMIEPQPNFSSARSIKILPQAIWVQPTLRSDVFTDRMKRLDLFSMNTQRRSKA